MGIPIDRKFTHSACGMVFVLAVPCVVAVRSTAMRIGTKEEIKGETVMRTDRTPGCLSTDEMNGTNKTGRRGTLGTTGARGMGGERIRTVKGSLGGLTMTGVEIELNGITAPNTQSKRWMTNRVSILTDY